MSAASIPMQTIGPIHVISGQDEIDDQVKVPLATFESPLWPSTNRGAKVTRLSGGIATTVVDDRMTRSVLFEAESAGLALEAVNEIKQRQPDLHELVGRSSRYANLLDVNSQIVGNLIYLRFDFSTGDASGHNMATKSAQELMEWVLQQYPQLSYVSISANFCTDKKVSAANGLLGRGKNVIAEVTIPHEICQQHLHTSAEAIVDLNLKKNYIGSTVAGGLRTANAHFANMLLAFYLATGQDAANIVEGSQGFVHTAVKAAGLYFSVTIPNLILGTIGNGKDLDFVTNNLRDLGCLDESRVGLNARRLAQIAAATVLCGELSLMAALTNPGELMRAHTAIERKGDVRFRT